MYQAIGKRLLDLVIAVPALLLLIPVFLVIGLVIKRDSPGPVFFWHKRAGKDGRPFMVLKFRSMISNASSMGPQHTQPGDRRVTKVGAILRRYSLDELPQLWNVIKGEMSLVGPRPDAYNEQLTDIEQIRVRVAPGMTGLAQVNGRSLLNLEQKMAYDRAYVENVSFGLDVTILMKTVLVVLGAKGVNSQIPSATQPQKKAP